MTSRLPIISLVIVALVCQSCQSTMTIEKPKDFYKYIGMDGDQTGIDLVTDTDGNAYILGTSRIASEAETLGQQVYVVMTNPKGEVGWHKTFGGAGDDVPKDIELATDGTLIVLADRPDGDFVIYRLDKTTGAESKPAVISGLEKLMGSAASEDHANSITQTTDGFIVAGYVNHGTYKSVLIARYYADMTAFPTSWLYTLGRFSETLVGYDFIPMKVLQKGANNFLAFGYTNSPGTDGNADYDYFVLSTNSLNDPLGGLMTIDADAATHPDDRLSSVRPAPVQSGGGYILTGYTSGDGTTQNIFVARILQDPSANSYIQGNPRKLVSNPSNFSNATAYVWPSILSGFYIVGNEGTIGDNNLYLTKLDNDLGDAWGKDNPARALGGVGDDAGGAVVETADGRILVVGTMVLGDLKGQRKIVLMSLNSEGYFGN